MQRRHVVGALWLTACATVIGTAGLVSYDPCSVGESGDAQGWMMVIVSGAVVTSAAFFTFAGSRAAAARLVLAAALGFAVAAALIAVAPGAWIGACSG